MRYLITILLFLALTKTKAQVVINDSTQRLLFEKEFALFNLPQDSQYLAVLTQKAQLYRTSEKYFEAIRELERGVTLVKDSGVVYWNWKYEALLNYYMAGEFQKAGNILENFKPADAEANGRKKEYLFLRWGTFVENNQWEKSKEEMQKFCEENNLVSLLEQVKQLPTDYALKKPEKARVLSAIVPGTGSLYAGYALKGITSFIIVGGLAGLTVALALHEFYVTALVSGFTPMLKFHKGNVKLSDQLAHRKNTTRAIRLKESYYATLNSVLNTLK